MFERYIEIARNGKSEIPRTSAKEIKETRGNSKPYQNLHKVITGRHADIALDEMEKDGILALIIPGINDVVAMKDPSGKRRFKDLWWHTKLVVMQAKPKLEVRWAALFHDFGKPSCFNSTVTSTHLLSTSRSSLGKLESLLQSSTTRLVSLSIT